MATSAEHLWTCEHCHTEQTNETWCETCQRARFASTAIQLAEHVLEHLADGISEPLEMLKAMQARPAYKRWHLTLQMMAQQMRLLTKDTTALAQALVKARSARTMLEVLEDGDASVKVRVLEKWGPRTNAEQVEHKVDQVTRHVVELHEGPPPKAS